ncbi:FimV family protein [Neptunomonas sp.]|uniref:type IV pilus assembly protein FimV n=1 Tax=Neptunomonas sp. TaxID=1971898 RepID=UPI00356334AA
MRVATFRGEPNVADIAENLFARLNDTQREKVVEQLLKANPQLRNISKMKKGTILRVPSIPELSVKTTRSLENSSDQVAEELADALNNFEARMQKRTEEEIKNTQVQLSVLKSDNFQAIIADSDVLHVLAKNTAEALETRSKELPKRHDDVSKAIRLGLDDLKTMLK